MNSHFLIRLMHTQIQVDIQYAARSLLIFFCCCVVASNRQSPINATYVERVKLLCVSAEYMSLTAAVPVGECFCVCVCVCTHYAHTHTHTCTPKFSTHDTTRGGCCWLIASQWCKRIRSAEHRTQRTNSESDRERKWWPYQPPLHHRTAPQPSAPPPAYRHINICICIDVYAVYAICA